LDCLNTDDHQQIDRTCDLLQYMFTFLDPVLLLDRYGGILQHALAHKNIQVPTMILKQLLRFSQDEDLAVVIGSHAIYPVAVQLLSADLSVSSKVFTLQYQLAECGAVGLMLYLATSVFQFYRPQ